MSLRIEKVQWEFHKALNRYFSKMDETFIRSHESQKYLVAGKLPEDVQVKLAEVAINGHSLDQTLSGKDLNQIKDMREGYTGIVFEAEDITDVDLDIYFFPIGTISEN